MKVGKMVGAPSNEGPNIKAFFTAGEGVMGADHAERRLVAMLAADIVGYSRFIEADEAGTLVAMRASRFEAIDPLVAEYHGRIVKQGRRPDRGVWFCRLYGGIAHLAQCTAYSAKIGPHSFAVAR